MFHFKEVLVKNKSHERKTLVIEFEDPKKAIIGEFLMTDASLLDYGILEDIDRVLSGEGTVEETSGNRCALNITTDTTRVEDLLAEIMQDSLPTYEIKTKKLRDLIIMWKNRKISIS